MEEIISYFKVKRNLVNLLILAILIAGIPIAVQLARQQQILKSRAAQNLAVDFLTKDQGGTDCVTTRGTGANNLVATCKDVKLRLTGGISTISIVPTTGTLIQGPDSNDPKVYLIEAEKKRWITSLEVFNACGFKVSDIVHLDSSTIASIPNGQDINLSYCTVTTQ